MYAMTSRDNLLSPSINTFYINATKLTVSQMIVCYDIQQAYWDGSNKKLREIRVSAGS